MQLGFCMTKEEHIADLKKYINNTPALQSLLYDLDLMPEQLPASHPQHEFPFHIAAAWRRDRQELLDALEKYQALIGTVNYPLAKGNCELG